MDEPEVDPRDIVGRFIEDPGSFELLRAQVAQVHRKAPYLVDLEDLLQDVVLRALTWRSSFQGTSRNELLGWFRTIAERRLTDYLRLTSRRADPSKFREIRSGRSSADIVDD